MDILWSPWRMAFIDPKAAQATAGEDLSGEKGSEESVQRVEQSGGETIQCVFCRALAADESQDRANLVVHRGGHNFIILNLYPYNTGHLLIVPNRHLGDFKLAAADELSEMMTLLQRMVRVVGSEYRPEGFNAGMNMGRVAGAGIADHIHMHLVPRWGGDTNFMSVVGQTKVMPEALDTTYSRIKRALDQDTA